MDMCIAKILVVEDEAPVRDSTMRVLESKGFEVEPANTGEEALAKIERGPFDLLLIDIRMPGMSGLEMLRRVKQMEPEICALIITGYGTIESAIEAIEAGNISGDEVVERALEYLMGSLASIEEAKFEVGTEMQTAALR